MRWLGDANRDGTEIGIGEINGRVQRKGHGAGTVTFEQQAECIRTRSGTGTWRLDRLITVPNPACIPVPPHHGAQHSTRHALHGITICTHALQISALLHKVKIRFFTAT